MGKSISLSLKGEWFSSWQDVGGLNTDIWGIPKCGVHVNVGKLSDFFFNLNKEDVCLLQYFSAHSQPFLSPSHLTLKSRGG